MAIVKLIGRQFFKELEEELITSIGVSLTSAKKVVSARTIKSVRAETILKEDSASVLAYGGAGLPFIVKDKPAGTKYPVIYRGDTTNARGKVVKQFELVPELRDWKAITGFGGSDFMLARAIAENPRKAVDIATPAIERVRKIVIPKVLKQYRTIFAATVINELIQDLKEN